MPHDIELTVELHQLIAAGIRAGADPRDAAQAWQVPARVFEDWLARGEGDDAPEPYRSFASEVRIAQAQARTKATIDVFQNAPRIWLESGPGKTEHAEVNALLDRAFMEACNVVVQALMPFPEARACASQALVELMNQKGETHAKNHTRARRDSVSAAVQCGRGQPEP